MVIDRDIHGKKIYKYNKIGINFCGVVKKENNQ
jgi:hypothetical protein